MKHDKSTNIDRRSERGAALVTVILIALLLGTACIALLLAVGAGSKNNADALSEYKAYYAAESGLQATINVLRNDSTATYSYAVANPTLASKLTYTTINGISQVAVDGETGYSVAITDPDNSAGLIASATSGSFKQADGTYASTYVFGTAPNTLTLSYNGATNPSYNPAASPWVSFGTFQVVRTSASAPTAPTAAVNFRIDYSMADPRPASRTIRGTIGTDRSVSFVSETYGLMGSTITLCNSNGPLACSPPVSGAWNNVFTLPLATLSPQTAGPLYGKMTAIAPYRLKVLATGYGPNSATKQLEAIIQRNFFNDLGSSAAISMIGPNAFFGVGPSHQMQILGGSVPSVAVSDSTGLTNVTSAHTNGTLSPPPEILSSDIPDWQQSPAQMDALIRQLRQTAQNTGRYFTPANPPPNFGNYSAGTGLTFCEGSCSMGNNDGGGIIVCTGTFSTSGNPRFRGLILAVGQYVSSSNPGGVVRSGGGNEVFTGNIVIAPYNPNNLAAGWGQPRYDQNGGPGDTINSDVVVDQALDGTLAISNFMLGVAEK